MTEDKIDPVKEALSKMDDKQLEEFKGWMKSLWEPDDDEQPLMIGDED